MRSGGSWLALKALPLALLWPGLARGSPRTCNVAALVLLLYFIEGIVRAVSEHGRTTWIAALSAVLSTVAFASLYLADRKRLR
jgi:uncharacterized membrane protein